MMMSLASRIDSQVPTKRLALTVSERLGLLLALAVLVSSNHAFAETAPESEEATFRVLGLFMEIRVEAFKHAAAEIENLDVLKVDYQSGEAILRLSGPLRIQKGNVDKQLRALNERVRIGTRGAFEIVARGDLPLAERSRIEIPIKGHDCLGCSFGAYRAVYKAKGVYRVTADYGEGRLVAWIDPKKTDRETLESELVKKKVVLAGKTLE